MDGQEKRYVSLRAFSCAHPVEHLLPVCRAPQDILLYQSGPSGGKKNLKDCCNNGPDQGKFHRAGVLPFRNRNEKKQKENTRVKQGQEPLSGQDDTCQVCRSHADCNIAQSERCRAIFFFNSGKCHFGPLRVVFFQRSQPTRHTRSC